MVNVNGCVGTDGNGVRAVQALDLFKSGQNHAECWKSGPVDTNQHLSMDPLHGHLGVVNLPDGVTP